VAPDSTIVCAVDTSPRAGHVAEVTRSLAEALDAGVVLVHVFDPMMVPAPPSRELDRLLTTEDIERHARHDAHHALAGRAEVLGDAVAAALLVEGRPEESILRVVDDHDARLLVAGSAGLTPLERVMGGSMAGRLAVTARCPVAVVTDGASACGAGPVLAAYDGSAHSMRAARHGAALATRMGRELVLMHVAARAGEGVQADRELASELHAAARACAPDGPGLRLAVSIVVEHGDPVEVLTAAARARDAALLVVGSRGRNELRAALLGSVSAGLVRSADRPVVVAGPRSEELILAAAS
jgi:nucleotide-binding universal stress UspA family protein